MESSSLPLAPKHRRHKVDAPLADAGVLPTDVLHDVLLQLPATHTSGHPLVAGLHKGLREVHIAELLSGNIVRRMRIPQDCKRLTTQLDVVCASAWYDPTCFVLEKGRHEVSTMPEVPGCNATLPAVLGYAPSTGEYKVLFLQFYMTRNKGLEQLCYVMTLDRGEARPKWRVAPGPAVPVEPDSGSMAVVGGVTYFLHHDHLYVTVPASLDPDSIASFDLAAEKWRATPIRGPLSSLVLRIGGDKLSYNKDNRKDFQLTELGGSLVIVHCIAGIKINV